MDYNLIPEICLILIDNGKNLSCSIKNRLYEIFKLSYDIEELKLLHFASGIERYNVDGDVFTINLENGYGVRYTLLIDIINNNCRLCSVDKFQAYSGDPVTINDVYFFDIIFNDNSIPSEITFLCSNHLVRQKFVNRIGAHRDPFLFPGMSSCDLLSFEFEIYFDAAIARQRNVSAVANHEFKGEYYAIVPLEEHQLSLLPDSYRKNYLARKNNIYFSCSTSDREVSLSSGFKNPVEGCMLAGVKIVDKFVPQSRVPGSTYSRVFLPDKKR